MKSTQLIRITVPLLLALLVLAACSNLTNNPAADEGELATSAAPTIYYVSTNGNDGNDGSKAKPFKSLKKALSVVESNQTIQMRGGTYFAEGCGNDYIRGNDFKKSGKENAPITVESYPGESAVIDGRNCRPSRNVRNGKVLTSNPKLLNLSEDWYVFQNLTFRYGAGRAIYVQGDHNVFRNVISHSNHSDGFYSKGNFNVFERSESYNNFNFFGKDSNPPGKQDQGDSADGIKIPFPAKGNVVRHFRAYNNSDDGIDIYTSSDATVEYSISYRNGRGKSGNGQGYKLGGRLQGNDMEPTNNIAKFNIAYSNKSFNFDYNNSNDIKMFGNTSFNSGQAGFRLGANEKGANNVAKCNLSIQSSGTDVKREGAVKIEYKNSWNLSGNEGPRFTSTDENNRRFLQVGTTANVSPACNIYDPSMNNQEISTPYIGALAPGKTLSEAPFNKLPPQTCNEISGSNTCGTDSSNFWRPSNLR